MLCREKGFQCFRTQKELGMEVSESLHREKHSVSTPKVNGYSQDYLHKTHGRTAPPTRETCRGCGKLTLKGKGKKKVSHKTQ